MPVRSPLDLATRSKEDKPSEHRIKRKDDNGSPCLKPRDGQKFAESLLLISTFEKSINKMGHNMFHHMLSFF